jgi:hypothetical protein
MNEKMTKKEMEDIVRISVVYFLSEIMIKKIKAIVRSKKKILLPDDEGFKEFLLKDIMWKDSMRISSLAKAMYEAEFNKEFIKSVVADQSEYISFPDLKDNKLDIVKKTFPLFFSYQFIEQELDMLLSLSFSILNNHFIILEICQYAYLIALKSIEKKIERTITVTPMSYQFILDFFNPNLYQLETRTESEEKLLDNLKELISIQEKIGKVEDKFKTQYDELKNSISQEHLLDKYLRAASFDDLTIFCNGSYFTIFVEYMIDYLYEKFDHKLLEIELDIDNAEPFMKEFQKVITKVSELLPSPDEFWEHYYEIKYEFFYGFNRTHAIITKVEELWETHSFTYFRDLEFVKRALKEKIDLKNAIAKFSYCTPDSLIESFYIFLEQETAMPLVKIAYGLIDTWRMKHNLPFQTMSEIDAAKIEMLQKSTKH